MKEATIVLVDGAETPVLDAHDRGLMYGDGVFRTLRVVAGRPRWWRDHLDKLTDDCRRLGIMPPEGDLWQADLDRLAGKLGEGSLKLLVTRGSGPRGYQASATASPRRLMYYAATAISARAAPRSVRIRCCRLRLGHQPALAGIKHLNRLENVLARSEWDEPEIEEGLLLDQSGNVISGVMSNLFLWRGQQLLTPRLDHCGVAGVTRTRLMRLAAADGIDVVERCLTLADVLEADEVMLTNSLISLWRVAALDGKTWPAPVISRQLAALLDG